MGVGGWDGMEIFRWGAHNLLNLSQLLDRLQAARTHQNGFSLDIDNINSKSRSNVCCRHALSSIIYWQFYNNSTRTGIVAFLLACDHTPNFPVFAIFQFSGADTAPGHLAPAHRASFCLRERARIAAHFVHLCCLALHCAGGNVGPIRNAAEGHKSKWAPHLARLPR